MNACVDATAHCCAECGVAGGVSLKVCKACMRVKYCGATCQKNHWATHKKQCKLRATELRDEALFKDPPPKEDCPICFLPMPEKLISCASLRPATRSSVPIYNFAIENEALKVEDTEILYPCCGKSICKGCIHSFCESGNNEKCPFCNSDQDGKAVEDAIKEIRKRVEANDVGAICLLADSYCLGINGFQQDQTKANELYIRAADLGCSEAHNKLGAIYHEGGALKKAKFHYEAAAMAGNEVARFNVGIIEAESGNMERAVKHWNIAASAGHYKAMFQLKIGFQKGYVSQESIDSSLKAYNNSCTEMRSEARDAYIQILARRLYPNLSRNRQNCFK